MINQDQCQNDNISFEQLLNGLDESMLTVDFWRARINSDLRRFKSIPELANHLASKDQIFAGAQGYLRLQNAVYGRASLIVTFKAVKIMNQLKPPFVTGG